MKRVIAHVDMDCFFCACEIKRNPKLKGKPIVVGSTGKRGVVSAANYEARKFNVRSATPIGIARSRLKNGIFLPVDGAYYRRESKNIMNTLKNISDDFNQASVDEAYLDITSFSKRYKLESVGKYIQKLILQNTGLSCSVGIAETTTVAKIASDYKKPAGITVVTNSKEFLDNLEIKKLPGVGKVSLESYKKHNINTIGNLAKLNRFTVIDYFGKSAIYLHKVSLGEDTGGILHRTISHSLSREHTFLEDENNMNNIINKLERLIDTVTDDLDNKSARTISIKLRFSDFTTITRDTTIESATKKSSIINIHAKRLLEKTLCPGEKIRLIGIKLTKLSTDNTTQTTLNLFSGQNAACA
jgi:nucleotidyltransferase/DNA polymerase involved in DNA repair